MIGTAPELSSYIRSFSDESYSGFNGWPETSEEVVSKWAGLIDILFTSVIPPSTTIELAKQAFQTAMLGITYNSPGIQMLQNAFFQAGVQIALGMQPTFTATPPPPPVIVLTGLITHSAEIEANNLGITLNTWAKTGLALNNSSGTTINWN